MLADVRLEPLLLRRTAAALINEMPWVAAHLRRYQLAGIFELPFVFASSGHFQRNTVGGKSERNFVTVGRIHLIECAMHVFNHRFDKAGMVIESPNLVYFGRLFYFQTG